MPVKLTQHTHTHKKEKVNKRWNGMVLWTKWNKVFKKNKIKGNKTKPKKKRMKRIKYKSEWQASECCRIAVRAYRAGSIDSSNVKHIWFRIKGTFMVYTFRQKHRREKVFLRHHKATFFGCRLSQTNTPYIQIIINNLFIFQTFKRLVYTRKTYHDVQCQIKYDEYWNRSTNRMIS